MCKGRWQLKDTTHSRYSTSDSKGKGREGGRKVRERKGEEGRGTEGKTVSSFLIRVNFCAFCQTGITKTLTIV